MGTTQRGASPGDVEEIARTRLEIKELADAWTRRHRLRKGTPEYDAELETEDQLLTRIWRRLRAVTRAGAETADPD